MYTAEKTINTGWTLIEEVATGDEFRVQNISNNTIRFCVTDTEPPADISGGVLPKDEQLAFKKVGGDLYLKCDGAAELTRITKVHIEKVE